MPILSGRLVIGFAATLVLVGAGVFAWGQRPGPAFPRAAADYFRGMDGGIPLEPATRSFMEERLGADFWHFNLLIRAA